MFIGKASRGSRFSSIILGHSSFSLFKDKLATFSDSESQATLNSSLDIIIHIHTYIHIHINKYIYIYIYISLSLLACVYMMYVYIHIFLFRVVSSLLVRLSRLLLSLLLSLPSHERAHATLTGLNKGLKIVKGNLINTKDDNSIL